MLTKEEKQLKEAMKVLVRDGKEGRLFAAARDRYVALKNDERVNNISHEINGVDWTAEVKKDIETIEAMI